MAGAVVVMGIPIHRFSNTGQNYGLVVYDKATHEESLSGNDVLTIVSRRGLNKREKLVWRDEGGTWHEHMVESHTREHSSGGPRETSYCVNSIAELYLSMVDGGELLGSVQYILGKLLEGTRWTAGACSSFGTMKLEVWHKNVRQCIGELCDLCGGELETHIEVDGGGVVSRSVRIVRRRGIARAARQFTYGRNMTNATRDVDSREVYTKVIGYGARVDEESEDEYSPRLTVEAHVDDQELIDRWGAPQADGAMGHSVMTYTDTQCTDQGFLQKQVDKLLAYYSQPCVVYEFEVVDAGDDVWAGVGVGNDVLCLDKKFDPPLEIRARVEKLTRNLSGKMECIVTIGKRREPLVEQFKAAEKQARESSGNNTHVYAETPVHTSGGASYSSGASGGSGGGDSITHMLDGIPITTGVISFTTVEQEAPTALSDMSHGTIGGVTDAEQGAAWGGGGNGEFSSSGGGGF